LANIKSQIKRNKQNEKRRLRNRVYRGKARISVRNARSAMDSGDQAESSAAILAAISSLDKAASKGVIHKKNAARRKGRLMKRMSSLGFEISKPAKVEKKSTEASEKKAAPAKKAAAKKTTKKTAKKASAKKTAKKSTKTEKKTAK
jgi:small subunit ribosomal protein S20